MTETASRPAYIHSCGFNSAMGQSTSEIRQCLDGTRQSNMVCDTSILNNQAPTIVGRVKDNLPPLPESLSEFDSRNNRLALSALLQIEVDVNDAIAKYGSNRIAVIIGTSTSGIYDGELAYQQKIEKGVFPEEYHYRKQELGNSSEFVSQYLNISGPCYSISTACSSSGRAFLSAQRLLESQLVDAVVVGGVDTLCQLTLNGFNSLEALSKGLSQPFCTSRDGINIGEAAAFMLLTREPSSVALLGVGDSSDAYHISAPSPDGSGAEEAMRKALADANLDPDQIGYINAHGTATPLNDSMESKAIYRVFGKNVPVSSTKPLTGHTLGAASATEAAIAWHILEHDLSIPLQNCENQASDIQITLAESPVPLQRKAILSNSFAFGGNNISLIFGYTHD
ncbi:3-oxoacyl-(ACP) synthase fabV like [Vibrio ishigakensis]|uniref:3-oxoacyl-(ACP) synthase fabV like n=1 Tax=Vibrio ishigakensis TaxID=1481914 RepID=A0A0B8QVG4_9VIBR|nr:3-oxoacyl-(ACP) synthase fabV like [Vibrio ishigakensis]